MAESAQSGVVVVDKPRGVTSHDVVAQARKLFGRRDVGHAGTLDPMATGVLLLLVGQACKLSGYLTADSKRYRAEITFGAATDSLDADGKITETATVRPEQLTHERVAGALLEEQSRTLQVPPAVSAIKVDGARAYALARAGSVPELAERAVQVLELKLVDLDFPRLGVELLVTKGFYVRSFARDLGVRLGLPAHLSALRRLASGPFGIDQALAWPCPAPPPLVSLAEAAAAALPACRLEADAVARARQGKRLSPGDFSELPAVEGPGAWLSPSGELVAIGSTRGELKVLRGFNSEP